MSQLVDRAHPPYESFLMQAQDWRRLRHFRTQVSKSLTPQTKVTPQDVESLNEAGFIQCRPLHKGKFAAYAFRRRELFTGDSKMCLCVELAAYGSEIVSFSPVLEYSKVQFAPIGFPRLLNGTGSVLSCSGKRIKLSMLRLDLSQQNGNQESGDFDSQLEVLGFGPSDKCILFEVKIKGCGEFLVYANQKPLDIWMGSYSIPFDYKASTGELRFEIGETSSMNAVIQVLFK